MAKMTEKHNKRNNNDTSSTTPIRFSVLILVLFSCSSLSWAPASSAYAFTTQPPPPPPTRTNPFGTSMRVETLYNHRRRHWHSNSLWMNVAGNDGEKTGEGGRVTESDSGTEGESEAVVVDEVITSDGVAVSVLEVPKWKRVLLFYKYRRPTEDDGLTFRQKLAKAGLSVVLSYGFVSNMSYCVSVSIAWYIFCKRTQLSPLAPGQWKSFLAVYSGFWVFNNIVRPIRFGASVALSTQFDKVVAWIQDKTKCSKAAAVGLVVFFANIVGTITLMCSGIAIAAALAGVPIKP